MPIALWICCTSLVAVFSVAETFAATSQRKVVIGHAALNARVAPLWIAEDHGFFIKHGISGNSIFIRLARVLVAALTAGDVHAAYTGGTTVLTAVAGGADLKIIAMLTNRLGYDVVAAPNIKTAKICAARKLACKRWRARCGWAPCSVLNIWASTRSATRSLFS